MSPDLYRPLLAGSVALLLLLSGYVVIDAQAALRRPLAPAIALRRWRLRLYAAIGATAAGLVTMLCAVWAMLEVNRVW